MEKFLLIIREDLKRVSEKERHANIPLMLKRGKKRLPRAVITSVAMRGDAAIEVRRFFINE